jgi:hypothetical protein
MVKACAKSMVEVTSMLAREGELRSDQKKTSPLTELVAVSRVTPSATLVIPTE